MQARNKAGLHVYLFFCHRNQFWELLIATLQTIKFYITMYRRFTVSWLWSCHGNNDDARGSVSIGSGVVVTPVKVVIAAAVSLLDHSTKIMALGIRSVLLKLFSGFVNINLQQITLQIEDIFGLKLYFWLNFDRRKQNQAIAVVWEWHKHV